MYNVYKLTEEQKDLLIGSQYTIDSYFNPIQDYYDNWIISSEEVNGCTNQVFLWVSGLEQIEYNPKIFS